MANLRRGLPNQVANIFFSVAWFIRRSALSLAGFHYSLASPERLPSQQPRSNHMQFRQPFGPNGFNQAWPASRLSCFSEFLHAVVLKTGLWTQNSDRRTQSGFTCSASSRIAFTKFPAGWEGMQIETEPADFSIYALASTLVWISLSFSGFNAAVYVTGEVENPESQRAARTTAWHVRSSHCSTSPSTSSSFSERCRTRSKPSPTWRLQHLRRSAVTVLQPLIRIIVSVALLSSGFVDDRRRTASLRQDGERRRFPSSCSIRRTEKRFPFRQPQSGSKSFSRRWSSTSVPSSRCSITLASRCRSVRR